MKPIINLFWCDIFGQAIRWKPRFEKFKNVSTAGNALARIFSVRGFPSKKAFDIGDKTGAIHQRIVAKLSRSYYSLSGIFGMQVHPNAQASHLAIKPINLTPPDNSACFSHVGSHVYKLCSHFAKSIYGYMECLEGRSGGADGNRTHDPHNAIVDACREVFTESGSRHKTSIKSFGDAGWRALWIILASILSFWTLKAIAETDHFPFERPATPVTGPRSKLHSKGSQPSMQSTFKSVRAWRRAGSPVPIAPISHTNDGRLKTGPGTAWGE